MTDREAENIRLGNLKISLEIGDKASGGIEVRSSIAGKAVPELKIMAICETARLLHIGADKLLAAACVYDEYIENTKEHCGMIDMSALAQAIDAYKEGKP